jgi:hypothetical protein
MEGFDDRYRFTWAHGPQVWPRLIVARADGSARGTYVAGDPNLVGPGGSRKIEAKAIMDAEEEVGNEMPLAVLVLLHLGDDALRQWYTPEPPRSQGAEDTEPGVTGSNSAG